MASGGGGVVRTNAGLTDETMITVRSGEHQPLQPLQLPVVDGASLIRARKSVTRTLAPAVLASMVSSMASHLHRRRRTPLDGSAASAAPPSAITSSSFAATATRIRDRSQSDGRPEVPRRSFAELDRSTAGRTPDTPTARSSIAAGRWDAMLETIDASTAGANVRVTDFELGINDAAVNDRKLQWLERLMLLPDRYSVHRLVGQPRIRPDHSPTAAGHAGRVLWYYDRLARPSGPLRDRDRGGSAAQPRRVDAAAGDAIDEPVLTMKPPSWLEHETEYNSFLRALRKSSTRTPIAISFWTRSRARPTYYAGLWESCHDDDKLLLYHLARHGLANGRNRRTLRRHRPRARAPRSERAALQRDLPPLHSRSARRENLAAAPRRAPGQYVDACALPSSRHHQLPPPPLRHTEATWMSTTTALATALTTGLPVLMKLVGTFTERRSTRGSEAGGGVRSLGGHGSHLHF